MRTKTAHGVAEILGLVEAFLTTTKRPRKRPGCDRPLAQIGTKEVWHLTKKTSFFELDRVSLAGAFRLAAIEQGYSRYVRELAEYELRWQYWDNDGCYGDFPSLLDIDNNEQDSRELIRAARRGRRFVERIAA